MDIDGFYKAMDERKKLTAKGVEYWMAREIQSALGYETWQRFAQAIERAMQACESMGTDPKYWFSSTAKPIVSGKGGIQQRHDFFLTRFACYLIAMNGDPAKPEVAMAQAYFAVQTRQQELQGQLTEAERRVEKRLQVKNHNRHLAGAAKGAGVPSRRFGIFQDRGYIGLYTMASKAIKQRKGIPANENHLDYAGFEELAANDFRITQTARRLTEANIRDEQTAGAIHEEIGRRVRQTIKENKNPMPEDLAAEPHIKTLMKGKSRKRLKS